MPHMVAQEHMGYVDALRYGTARNHATLAAALSAIGSAGVTLVLTMSGDGVWTIGSNLTSPGNVAIFIPAGVTVNIATGVTWTINGVLFAQHTAYKTGLGTFVNAPATAMEMSNLLTTRQNIVGSGTPLAVSLLSDATHAVLTSVEANVAHTYTIGPAIADAWQVGINPANFYYIARPTLGFGGSAVVTVGHSGLGLITGAALPATHLLHLGADDAFKATTLWSIPSDARLKTVLGDFTDGLDTICALPQSVRFQWNGKGGTLDDGRECVGRIAQDVLPVAPYLIHTYQDRLEPTDPEPVDLYSANDSPIIEMLINAVKELAARVETLEAAAGPALPRRAAEAEDDEPEARPARRKRSNG